MIKEPRIGTFVRHSGFGFEDNPNYPCDVLIVDGHYMINNRLSNWWEWRRILSNGELSVIECGYGSFEKSNGRYILVTKAERID